MRANSVRIHAQKLFTNFSKDSCPILICFTCAQIQKGCMWENGRWISVRIYVEFWLALNAHKFIKVSGWKLSTGSFRFYIKLWLALDIHTDLNELTCTHTLTYTHALTHLPTYTNTLKTFTQTLTYTHTFQHTHSPTHTSSYIYLTKR